MDLTLLAALLAGLLSFLSPCVLPVVPAYLGQLGVVAVGAPARTRASPSSPAISSLTPQVAGASIGSMAAGVSAEIAPSGSVRASGWRTLPNAVAFILGFGAVFTLLGTTAYVALGPLTQSLPILRQIGGIILIALGLNLMGVLRLRSLAGSWRPLDRFISRRPGAERRGILSGLSLGAIFAVGWTPCIGPTLGAILTLSAIGTSPQVIALLVAYSIGLGVPFLLMAVAVDRAPGLLRPLQRHGRTIELMGEALVIAIGVALLFDLMGVFYRAFGSLIPLI